MQKVYQLRASISFNTINPEREAIPSSEKTFAFIFTDPHHENEVKTLCAILSEFDTLQLYFHSHQDAPATLPPSSRPSDPPCTPFWQCTLYLLVQCKVPLEKCSKFN